MASSALVFIPRPDGGRGARAGGLALANLSVPRLSHGLARADGSRPLALGAPRGLVSRRRDGRDRLSLPRTRREKFDREQERHRRPAGHQDRLPRQARCGRHVRRQDAAMPRPNASRTAY